MKHLSILIALMFAVPALASQAQTDNKQTDDKQATAEAKPAKETAASAPVEENKPPLMPNQPKNKEYKPTEEISEDLSVSYPVDI